MMKTTNIVHFASNIAFKTFRQLQLGIEFFEFFEFLKIYGTQFTFTYCLTTFTRLDAKGRIV